MRSRRRLLALGLVLLAVGGPAAWWLARPGPRINEAAYEQIGEALAARPLTLADVEAILGGPAGDYGGQEPGQYLPRHILRGGPDLASITPDQAVLVLPFNQVEPPPGGGRFELARSDVTEPFMPIQSWAPAVGALWTMDEFRALPLPRRVVVWTGPYYAIAVQLDAQDGVINACLAKNFRAPGRWERWLEWLGVR